jgi:hypothetical protein
MLVPVSAHGKSRITCFLEDGLWKLARRGFLEGATFVNQDRATFGGESGIISKVLLEERSVAHP